MHTNELNRTTKQRSRQMAGKAITVPSFRPLSVPRAQASPHPKWSGFEGRLDNMGCDWPQTQN